ncbi:MAG: hypothetical protein FWD57_15595 [Polyangiaceae bacterium]|nr:hypothetical protein [Polyangiaceae bacterium]
MKPRSSVVALSGIAVCALAAGLSGSCSTHHSEDGHEDVNPFFLQMALTMPIPPADEMTVGINWNGTYSVLVPPNTHRMGTLSEEQHAGFRHHAACVHLEPLWFHRVDSNRCVDLQTRDAYWFGFHGPQTDDPNDMGCGMTVCIAPDTIEGPTREHVDFLLGLFDELTAAHAE